MPRAHQALQESLHGTPEHDILCPPANTQRFKPGKIGVCFDEYGVEHGIYDHKGEDPTHGMNAGSTGEAKDALQQAIIDMRVHEQDIPNIVLDDEALEYLGCIVPNTLPWFFKAAPHFEMRGEPLIPHGMDGVCLVPYNQQFAESEEYEQFGDLFQFYQVDVNDLLMDHDLWRSYTFLEGITHKGAYRFIHNNLPLPMTFSGLERSLRSAMEDGDISGSAKRVLTTINEFSDETFFTDGKKEQPDFITEDSRGDREVVILTLDYLSKLIRRAYEKKFLIMTSHRDMEKDHRLALTLLEFEMIRKVKRQAPYRNRLKFRLNVNIPEVHYHCSKAGGGAHDYGKRIAGRISEAARVDRKKNIGYELNSQDINTLEGVIFTQFKNIRMKKTRAADDIALLHRTFTQSNIKWSQINWWLRNMKQNEMVFFRESGSPVHADVIRPARFLKFKSGDTLAGVVEQFERSEANYQMGRPAF